MLTITIPDTVDNILPLAELDWFELSTLPRFISTSLEYFTVFLLEMEI
jgi:hypothetical protein